MPGYVFSLLLFSLLSVPFFNGNTMPLTEPEKVYISAVITTPTESEAITLKNSSGTATDISGWTIGDKNDPTAYTIPAHTILQQTQTITFTHTTLGFQINDAAEVLYLKNGALVMDVWE